MKPHTELFHSFPTMKLYEGCGGRGEGKRRRTARQEDEEDGNNSDEIIEKLREED